MKGQVFARSALAAAVLTAVTGGIVYSSAGAAVAQTTPVSLVAPSSSSVTHTPGLATATDFSGIVEKAGPAVVNISVTGKSTAADDDDSAGIPGLSPDDPMNEFFRRFGPQAQMPSKPHMTRGQGSGFIVSADGLILTNAHVVDGATDVTVRLTDRREFKAKVLGADKQSDIAVIRIDAKDLPVVRIGNPGDAKVGEPVLAIGSPYGFDNTATAGIISAKSRSLPEDTYVPFIQTDVAVNPGNSGGPLFNAQGEVIGINSQIYSRTGGYQGLSFAIPIDVATKVQQQLVAHGHVTRGRLGVAVQEVNQALARSFGLEKAGGALVSSVEKDSPAAKGGLQVGDVITGFNGRAIEHSSDLPAAVADATPGSAAKVTVMREKAEKTLSVTIGEWKVAQSDAKKGQSDQAKLGLAVRQLSPQERAQSGIESGLLVASANGPAAVAGIQAGDVILAFNGVPLKDVEQLRKLVDGAGKNVALLVQRDDSKIFIPLTLG